LATKLTENGVSTTTGKDRFRYEKLSSPITKRTYIQWDYRGKDGKLHSGVARTLGDAVKKAMAFGYSGANVNKISSIPPWRFYKGRRWKADRCKPLAVLVYLVYIVAAAIAVLPIAIWLLGGTLLKVR